MPDDPAPDAGGGGTGGMVDRPGSGHGEPVRGREDWSESPLEKGPPSLGLRAFRLLEDPRSSSAAWIISMSQMLLIVLSIVALVLETEPDMRAIPREVYEYTEIVCTIVFTVEYLVRLLVAPYGAPPEKKRPRMDFALQVANLFDLLAILPLYIQWGMQNSNAQGLRVLRIVRLTRVFRVFKLGKYSESLMLITEGLKRSYQALQLMIFLMVVGMVIFASFFFLCEKDTIVNNLYVFSTIPDACWFVFVTFTTAGFGDAYPVTWPGHFLAIIAMLSGIVLLAMPISIIGQKFTQVYKELQRKNIDKSAQAAELRVLLTTLCSIMREVHELASELETANQAVLQDVVSLAKDVANLSLPGPEPSDLSYRRTPDEDDGDVGASPPIRDRVHAIASDPSGPSSPEPVHD